jgi:hypothetical protein
MTPLSDVLATPIGQQLARMCAEHARAVSERRTALHRAKATSRCRMKWLMEQASRKRNRA